MESIGVPDGFRLFTENTSHILLSANDAFLNPVQEFNRDLSVACIRTWSEDRNHEKEQTWWKSKQGKTARAWGNKKLKGVLQISPIAKKNKQTCKQASRNNRQTGQMWGSHKTPIMSHLKRNPKYVSTIWIFPKKNIRF